MISQRQSETRAGERGRRGARVAAPGLAALVTAVRVAVAKRVNWRETAQLVASALERHLPSPSTLTAEQRTGDPDTYKSEVLHSEPDGGFSIVALVWLPGQVTPIHDHVTWCVFRGHPGHGVRGAVRARPAAHVPRRGGPPREQDR
jgi:hypothetical protein